MEDREDDDTLVVLHEEDLEWKSTCERATDDLVHVGVLVW
jgi:hypothetical protein